MLYQLYDILLIMSSQIVGFVIILTHSTLP